MATTRSKTESRSDGAAKMRSFQNHVDIPNQNKTQVIALLNQHLANTLDLYTQAKQAHWNVKGKDFYQLHLLFDQVAEMVFPFVDIIAERITALGGFATGTARMAAGASQLDEFPQASGGDECLRALIERYSTEANAAREAIDTAEQQEDMGTLDLFNEYVRELDKALWFLEAHVQG